MIISREKSFATDELFELYDSVGWGGYTRDMAKLQRSLSNSHLVITARDDSSRLVGLARTISDDETICYLQDLLVRSEFQGQGIGAIHTASSSSCPPSTSRRRTARNHMPSTERWAWSLTTSREWRLWG
jgi:hypothetical protein